MPTTTGTVDGCRRRVNCTGKESTRSGQRARRKNRRHKLWPNKLTHEVPPRITSDEQTRRPVWEETGILDALDAGNGVRNVLANNKVVVRVIVAGGQLRSNDNAVDEIHPASRQKSTGLNVPVASNDPWSSQCTHYGSCFFQQCQIFR